MTTPMYNGSPSSAFVVRLQCTCSYLMAHAVQAKPTMVVSGAKGIGYLASQCLTVHTRAVVPKVEVLVLEFVAVDALAATAVLTGEVSALAHEAARCKPRSLKRTQ